VIRLHHVTQARSFRVMWLLEEIGLDYEVVRHSFFDKSLRSEDYLALSPAGRVPAIEIDGRVIYESGAIIEYLCATRGLFGRIPGDPDWVDWLEWLHFAETIGQHLAALTQQHIALREDWMRSPTVMKLESMRLEKTLGVIEAGLGAHDWLMPSGFSAVDCAVGYSAIVARRFVRFDGLPRVAGWLARCEAREGFRRAEARDGTPEIYRRDFYEAPDV
jgi:glutathione S-transferase